MKPLATLLCLALLAGPLWADEKAAAPVTVPFELIKSQHIVVQVKVNGKGPYRLIFDTGAPVTLLSNKVARLGGVVPKNFRQPPFALFGSAGEFKVKTLEVGKAEAHDLKAIVMDHPTVDAIAKFVGPIEGIVGFSFWARFHLTIDYQARQMTFVPNKYQPPDVLQGVLKALTGDTAKKHILAPAGQWGFRVRKDLADKAPGVTVAEVLPGSPAAAAGLQAGDRLLVLDGRWTDSINDCYAAAADVRPGSSVRITVRHDAKERQLTVHVQPGL
jgi:hypothetical protein